MPEGRAALSIKSPESLNGDFHSSGAAKFGFACDGEGRTYLAEQFATYPFHVTRPFYLDTAPAGLATLYLQHLSGGVFQDDRLRLDVTLDAGSAAHLTTQASTKVHGMMRGHARQTVSATLAENAFFEAMFDPLILFPTARLENRTRLVVAPCATAIFSESFLFHDPAQTGRPFDWLDCELVVARPDGAIVCIDRFRADGAALAARCPGVSGDMAMQGSLFVITNQVPAKTMVEALRAAITDEAEVYGGASSLPREAGAWCRILAADAAVLRASLGQAWSAARALLTGAEPSPRRK